MGFDDFWNHAAVGRWILENKQFPHETLFLWTARQPWVAHSWGTQTVFALLMQAGEAWGPRLALLFAATMVASTFFVLWRLWLRVNPVASRATLLVALFFLLAIVASHSRFDVRPELFTALFLALLCHYLIGRHALETFRFGKAEFAFVALFVIWANLHGAFAVGLVTLGLTVLGDALQDRFDRRARILLLLLIGCSLATLLNPYGVQLWAALRQVNSYTFSFLNEWKPPLVNPALGWDILAPLGLLCTGAGAAWAMNPARRWAHFLWLAFWIYSFCNARRHLWLLAIICLVVLVANGKVFDSWMQRLDAVNKKRAQGLVLSPLLLNFLAGPLLNLARAGSDNDNLPIKLCDVLDEHNPPGRMFNGFINAAYLSWRFAGRREMFIDHLQAHPDSLIEDYQGIVNASSRGMTLLEERRIGYVILHNPRDYAPWPPLKDALNKSPNWELVFFDENAVLWVRKTPEYAALRAARAQYVPQELR